MPYKNRFLYLIEYAGLFFLLLFATLEYLNQEIIISFFNSDIVLFPSLFKDLFVNHNHYKDWFICPAPHFFPDMFLFIPIIFLTKNIYFQFLLTMLLMLTLIYFAVKYLYYQFFTRKISIFFALIVISFLLVLGLRSSPYNLLLLPTAHVGEYIIGIFLISIIIKLIGIKKGSNYNLNILYCCLAILIFLCSASDLLFVVQFSIPFVLAFLLLYIKKEIKFRELILLSSLCIIPTILGSFLSKYMVPHEVLLKYLGSPSLKKISYTTIVFQLSELVKLIKALPYLHWPIFFLFYLSLFVVVVLGLFINLNKNRYVNKKFYFLSLVIFFALLINMVSFCIFTNGVLDRYFISFYYSPYLLFFFPLYLFRSNLQIKIFFMGVFLIIFVYSFATTFSPFLKQKLKPKLSYYPDEVSCIDRSLPTNSHGIAQYWDANIFSVLSRKNIKVVPVSKNLEPMYWSINAKEFSKASNFVILSNFSSVWDLNPSRVFKAYGIPEKIIKCGTKKIFIYPKNSIRTIQKSLFFHSGDSFTWLAATLPSQIPNSKKENKRIAKSTDTMAFISYGPYIYLPAGKYHFHIHYNSSASSNVKVAFYDVFAVTIGEVFKDFIYGSKGKHKEISGKFNVGKLQDNNHAFEIRVFFLGKTKFILEDITLVKD